METEQRLSLVNPSVRGGEWKKGGSPELTQLSWERKGGSVVVGTLEVGTGILLFF